MTELVTLRPEKDPASIEARSFAIIEEEIGPARPFTGHCWEVARRLVHTTADFSLLDSLLIDETAVAAGVEALRRGRTVLTDTTMAVAGIPSRRTEPLGAAVRCLLHLPGVDGRARDKGITRSRAALELAGDMLDGCILAVGNAPTTLIALVDHLRKGGMPPALVIAMPVGFVNAAESKELLLQEARMPVIAIRGRRGGSPLAAATVNALAEIALRDSAVPD